LTVLLVLCTVIGSRGISSVFFCAKAHIPRSRKGVLSMRRVLLITTIALCILTASLTVSSGTVHAQAQARLTTQRQTVVNDQPTMYFSSGWGWGICYSHRDVQALLSDSNTSYARYLTDGLLGARYGWQGFVASAVLEGYFWLMSRLDHGNGICTAWLFGQPWAPVMWSR
jgi:hypothetical protein